MDTAHYLATFVAILLVSTVLASVYLRVNELEKRVRDLEIEALHWEKDE